MKPGTPLSPGDAFEAPYPFVRETYMEWDEEGGVQVPTWRPGVRNEETAPRPGWEPDVVTFADAVGRIILTVVSVHKPGRFAARVFYTRRWRDPDGREFGKNACRVTTVAAFRRLARGYRHEFVVKGTGPTEDGGEGENHGR